MPHRPRSRTRNPVPGMVITGGVHRRSRRRARGRSRGRYPQNNTSRWLHAVHDNFLHASIMGPVNFGEHGRNGNDNDATNDKNQGANDKNQGANNSQDPSTGEAVEVAGGVSFKCTICLETYLLHRAHLTVCGHIFCMSCIFGRISQTKKCPICQREVFI